MTQWVDDILNDPDLRAFKPARPWQAAQHERNLLFLHYRLTYDELRPLVPEPLELVEFDSSVWIALIAFEMGDVRFRMLPLPIPRRFRQFGEIDLAAIVRYRGRTGLYFLGIEGASRLTSWLTRTSTGLPYRYAPRTQASNSHGVFAVRSGPRRAGNGVTAEFDARYSRWDPARAPDPGSPVEMLAGQYSAFTFRRGRLCEFDEVHEPWTLHEAQVEMRSNTLLAAAGITTATTPEYQHFAHGRRVVSWFARPVDAKRTGLAPIDQSATRSAGRHGVRRLRQRLRRRR
jgi:uncharacterized protein